MKVFGCILIGALAIYTMAPALGYETQPLYGRTFNLFNLLTSPQALLARLTSLTSRLAILQSTYDILSSQFTALQSLVASLRAQLLAIQNSLPKCPSSVVGGVVLGVRCYTVKAATAGFIFSIAKSECETSGGILAEPPPNSAYSISFYAALKAKFPSQFTTVEGTSSKQLWIGYKQAGTAASITAPLMAISGSSTVQVPVDMASIISNTPVGLITNVYAAAIVGPTGASWFAADSVIATLPGYICQYPTL